MEILDYNKVKQTIDIRQRSLSVAKLIHIASSAFGIGVWRHDEESNDA